MQNSTKSLVPKTLIWLGIFLLLIFIFCLLVAPNLLPQNESALPAGIFIVFIAGMSLIFGSILLIAGYRMIKNASSIKPSDSIENIGKPNRNQSMRIWEYSLFIIYILPIFLGRPPINFFALIFPTIFLTLRFIGASRWVVYIPMACFFAFLLLGFSSELKACKNVALAVVEAKCGFETQAGYNKGGMTVRNEGTAPVFEISIDEFAKSGVMVGGFAGDGALEGTWLASNQERFIPYSLSKENPASVKMTPYVYQEKNAKREFWELACPSKKITYSVSCP